jgi:hypothetical protein
VSIQSASLLSLAPLASAGIACVSGGNWIPGAWVEWSASLAEDTYIAGVVLGTNVNHTGNQRIDISVGAIGAETVVGDITFRSPQLTSNSPVGKSEVWWEQPWKIAAGNRVSLRILLNTDSTYTQNLRLVTFPSSFVSDRKSGATPSHLPTGTPLTWSAPSAWTWSAWQELTAVGLAEGSTVASFSCNAGNFAEIQFGYGSAGSETILTTQQQTTKAYGQMYQPLPGPLPVPANTRLVVRVRQSTTGYTIAFAANIYGAEPIAPTEYDFLPEHDASGTTIGLTWVEHRDNAGNLHVSSKTYLQDDSDYYGGEKIGDIVAWGVIRRAISDYKGNYEGTTFEWQHSDVERFWRGLLAADSTKMMLNDAVVIRMISDEARRNKELARTIVRGLIRSYKPNSPLLFNFQAEDPLTKLFTKEVPYRRGSLLDFSGAQTIDANGVSTPLDSVGKGIPVIYGEMSDQNVSSTYGTTLTTPTGITAYVTGGTAGVTRRYAITLLTGDYGDTNQKAWDDHRGETDPAWITVNDCPTDEQMMSDPANHHVIIEVDTQAGAAGGRCYGRYPDSVYGLDALDYPGFMSVVPSNKWWYCDGWRPYGAADWNTQKFNGVPPTENTTSVAGIIDTGVGVLEPLYVGKNTISGTEYHVWIIAGHAVKSVMSWYIDKINQSSTTATGATGAWRIPGVDSEPLYRDINGRRYALILGRVGYTDPDAVSKGEKKLTINVQGIESIGDGSGTLITKGLLQYLHFLQNWAFNDYQSGSWLNSPAYPADPEPENEDLVYVIDSNSFYAADIVSDKRISGGYIGAWALTEITKISDQIQMLNQGFDVDCGFNRKTQFSVWMEDDNSELITNAKLYTEQDHIIENSFDIEDLEAEMFNDRPYSYRYRPLDGSFDVEIAPGTNIDSQSITDLEEIKTAETLQLYPIRLQPIAEDIAHRALIRTAYPPRQVTWKTSLSALDDELCNIILVNHSEGIGINGWENHALRLKSHETDPEECTIVLVLRDASYIFRRPFDISWLRPSNSSDGIVISQISDTQQSIAIQNSTGIIGQLT